MQHYQRPITFSSSDIAYTQSMLKAASEFETKRPPLYNEYVGTGIHNVALEGFVCDWTRGSTITATYNFYLNHITKFLL
jgi:hypothetical protein